jgi:hypothetical protein
MGRDNLEAVRQTIEANERLARVAEFLGRQAGRFKTAQGGLTKAAETITEAAVTGLEG